jgi:hypothetical protein
MVSSRSQLRDPEVRPTPATPAPATRWTSTFAFIKDQLLQFWPPYRTEIHDEGGEASGDPSAGKSEKPGTRLP